MAGPATIEDYQVSNWADTDAANNTPSITWLAGDLVVVLGSTEDTTKPFTGNPTATGLTFSLITSVTGSSNTTAYYWSATAAGGGSSVVTGPTCPANCAAGIAAFVCRSHNGAGTAATITGSSAKVISLGVVDSSSVVLGVFGDWAEAAIGTAATPTGTLRIAQAVTGRAAFYVLSWTAQAAGTRNYGYTGGGTPDNNGIVLEIKGTAAAGTKAPPLFHRSQRFMRRASGLILPVAGVLVPATRLIVPAPWQCSVKTGVY